MEKEHQLISATEVSQDNRRAVREELSAREAAKLYMQDAMSRHLPSATSTAALVAAMERDGIRVQATYQKEKLQAVVFEFGGHHLKGSELGRAYSGNNLTKTIEAQAGQVRCELVGVLGLMNAYGAAAQEAEAAKRQDAARQAQAAETARQVQVQQDAARRAQAAEVARQAQAQQARKQLAADQVRVRAAEQAKIEQTAAYILKTNPNILKAADLTMALAEEGVDAKGADGNRRLFVRGSNNEFLTTELRGELTGFSLSQQAMEKIRSNGIEKTQQAQQAPPTPQQEMGD